jgi:hypothetical protein
LSYRILGLDIDLVSAHLPCLPQAGGLTLVIFLILNIEALNIEGILLDELAPLLHLIAH